MSTHVYDLSEGWNKLTAEVLYAEMDGVPSAELDFYDRRIRGNGGMALDQACGTGRHLFALMARGLEVHGADISADALGFARKAAIQRGVHPTLYHQRMEDCDIPNQYGTIYVANGTFQIIVDRQRALSTLTRFRQHLSPGGQLLIELVVPDVITGGVNKNDEEHPRRWESARKGDKGTIITTLWTESIDFEKRTLIGKRRCELLIDGAAVRTEVHTLLMTWYNPGEIATMFEQAGLIDFRTYSDYTDQPATDESKSVVYAGQRPLSSMG